AQKSADSNLWYSVCYGNGMFVAVSGSGTGNRVMTSGSVGAAVRASNVFIDSKAVAEKDIQSAIESLNAKTSSLSDIVDNIHIPPASLTEAGIVQLSNETNGTRENVAATEKAVKDAGLWAKSYTDQQIGLVTETGIPKLVSYPLKVTATADNQKVFEIPLDLFDANTDTLLISINRAVLDPTQYTVTNTVRDEDGKVTQRAKITLLSGVAATSEVTMVVLKNVPIGPDGAINGAVLAVDSVPINRVNGLQDQLDLVFQSVSDGKQLIAAAITGKGVPASGSDTFATLADKINELSTGLKMATGTLNRGNSGTISNLPFRPLIVLLNASRTVWEVNDKYISIMGTMGAYLDGNNVVKDRIFGSASTNGLSANVKLNQITFGNNYVTYSTEYFADSVSSYIIFGV
ncbi:phage tail protein, partial [Paenibacillus azoreducens]|uniref:phage tail protein n=1 Tax=Paenibacillus azoreducens TaxID=116718 RepID=UPI0039F4B173